MMDVDGTGKRTRGRPKSFDRCKALHEAMKLFWERGYEGASFDELTAAMGISPSSFYNSFGSKERLYQEATEVYLARSGEWFLDALESGPDTRAAFRRVLSNAAQEFTQSDLPSGCMISLAGIQGPPALTPLRHRMAQCRQDSQAAMAARIRRGIAEGDVPDDTDAEVLAAYFSAVSRGMAVLARDGAGREQLAAIVECAMRAWPDRDGDRD